MTEPTHQHDVARFRLLRYAREELELEISRVERTLLTQYPGASCHVHVPGRRGRDRLILFQGDVAQAPGLLPDAYPGLYLEDNETPALQHLPPPHRTVRLSRLGADVPTARDLVEALGLLTRTLLGVGAEPGGRFYEPVQFLEMAGEVQGLRHALHEATTQQRLERGSGPCW